MTVDHNVKLERYADEAAGASEGQEPVGWAVREKHFPDRLLFSDETGEKPSQGDREWAERKGHEYVELYTHPSAEIAALREAMKGAAVIANNAGAEIASLRKELDHWKANHDFQVARARLLIERTDLPLERVRAYEELAALRERIAGMEKDAERWRWLKMRASVGDQRQIMSTPWGQWDAFADAAIEKEPK